MKAGYARIDITPEWPLELAGYGYYRGRVSQGVHDPLFARAVAFEQDGVRSLIISCDLVGLSDVVVPSVEIGLCIATRIDSDAVMIACTHTHSGPATLVLRGCGKMDVKYMEWVIPRLTSVGVDALNDLRDVGSVTWSEVNVDGIAFNRVYGDAGPVDSTVRTLVLSRTDARPIMVVNFACHPVANGVNDQVSADYPGHVVSAIEAQGYDCVFLTGFCGDIDPVGPRDYDAIRRHGESIASAALASQSSAVQVSGSDLAFGVRTIELPYDIPSRHELLNELLAARSRLEDDPRDLEALAHVSWITDALVTEGSPVFQTEPACVHALRIGDVMLIAFPGEVFTQFGIDLRERLGNPKLMTVNTANALIGYIPTADEFDRQGYASHAAAHIYAIHPFKKGFGELIAEQAYEMLARLQT